MFQGLDFLKIHSEYCNSDFQKDNTNWNRRQSHSLKELPCLQFGSLSS